MQIKGLEKNYQDDLSFQKACDAKAVELIDKHQERDHLKLVKVLKHDRRLLKNN